MKILHCCLSNFYIDHYNYQENVLTRQNKLDGHEVYIIASTFTFGSDGKGSKVLPGSYFNEDGILVKRIPYRRLPMKSKINAYPKVYDLISEFEPDVIMFHGSASWEVRTICKYKKKHPNVIVYIDSHSDYGNSATNWISKNILHKIFYRLILQQSLPYVEKFFGTTLSTMEFLVELYGIPRGKIESYPLGGTILNNDEYLVQRKERRKELEIQDDEILLVHAGKLDSGKRTKDIINAFSKVQGKNLKLIVIGTMDEKNSQLLIPLMEKNKKISYLGWKSGNELQSYLCAGDIYLQPGTVSATMQNAACRRCAIAVYPYKSYKVLFKENCWYIETVDDMVKLFDLVSNNIDTVKEMKNKSFSVAKEKLDYKKLASRIYKDDKEENYEKRTVK